MPTNIVDDDFVASTARAEFVAVDSVTCNALEDKPTAGGFPAEARGRHRAVREGERGCDAEPKRGVVPTFTGILLSLCAIACRNPRLISSLRISQSDRTNEAHPRGRYLQKHSLAPTIS
jgi:hypothetical protein